MPRCAALGKTNSISAVWDWKREHGEVKTQLKTKIMVAKTERKRNIDQDLKDSKRKRDLKSNKTNQPKSDLNFFFRSSNRTNILIAAKKQLFVTFLRRRRQKRSKNFETRIIQLFIFLVDSNKKSRAIRPSCGTFRLQPYLAPSELMTTIIDPK